MENINIFADTLATLATDFANVKISAEILGAKAFLGYKAFVRACLYSCYKYASATHDTLVTSDDHSDLRTDAYNQLKRILAMIGEVNGDTIQANKVFDLIVGKSYKLKKIDTSTEMAQARYEYKALKNSDNATEEALQTAKDKIKILESESGNCKKIFTMESETAFQGNLEKILGNAIANQKAMPLETILAEKEARRKERAERAKARKAKKNA